MSEASARTRDEAEAPIVARAWSDEAFRQRLRANPREAVQEVTGFVVPESIEIEVPEETPEKAYLVIPLNRVAMSEEELAAITGAGDYPLPRGSRTEP
jgi:Nitrile hydratase, alpha chain